jgi:hypothetical protein
VKAKPATANPLLVRFLERVERMHVVLERERRRQESEQATTCASEAKQAA